MDALPNNVIPRAVFLCKLKSGKITRPMKSTEARVTTISVSFIEGTFFQSSLNDDKWVVVRSRGLEIGNQ